MVGTDIIEVSRIEKLIKDKGDKFLNRIYTKKEIDYCESKGPNKYQHYAGRFAAKEAVFKILSTKQLKFKNIEILNNDDAELRTLESICVQHEIDHLNGIVCMDRKVDTTIRVETKIGRNQLVTIKKGDAVKVLKYKKAQNFLKQGWEIK